MGDLAYPTDPHLDILYISPDRFRQSPQRGVPCRMEWEALRRYLSRPSEGPDKTCMGGYSPALYQDNERRKAKLAHACAIVVDVDEDGDVYKFWRRFKDDDMTAIVHETFSSTPNLPRCRIIFQISRFVTAVEYERIHAVLCRGIPGADRAAKDASRLSFSPVRKPGELFSFAATDGTPLDVDEMLEAHPLPPPVAPPPPPRDASRYQRAALDGACQDVARATPGERHGVLLAKAAHLAKMGLGEASMGGLVEAFVRAAGESRRGEAVRAVRYAVETKGGRR